MEAPHPKHPRLLALLLALAPFVLAELALRSLGLGPYAPPPVRVGGEEAGGLHRPDPLQLWAPRPGAPIPWARSEAVSPGGLRGPDPRADAGPLVLALGDSSTFGWRVAQEQAWPRRLEGRLRAELPAAPAQVANAGVVASTLVQGVARYRALASRWRPAVVVACFGAINEEHPTRGAGDRARQEAARAGGASPLVRLARACRARSRLLALLERARPAGNAREERPRVTPEEFARSLEELLRAVRADGARLVLVLPVRMERAAARHPGVLAYDAELRAFARRSGTPLVDAPAAFARAGEEGRAPEELFLDGVHPSAAGHRLLGEAIAPAVRAALGE